MGPVCSQQWEWQIFLSNERITCRVAPREGPGLDDDDDGDGDDGDRDNDDGDDDSGRSYNDDDGDASESPIWRRVFKTLRVKYQSSS